MQIKVAEPDRPTPVSRAHVISIVIKSFKGRKNVDVHLFRSDWDESEKDDYDWDEILGAPDSPQKSTASDSSRQFLLEAFTEEERDQLIEYLQRRYESKISSIQSNVLSFPLPLGITPLSSVEESGDLGIMRFEKIPNYSLPFSVHGIYDLSRHEPISDLPEE